MPVILYSVHEEPNAKRFNPKVPDEKRPGVSKPLTPNMRIAAFRTFLFPIKDTEDTTYAPLTLDHVPAVNFVSLETTKKLEKAANFDHCVKVGSVRIIKELRTLVPGKCSLEDFYIEQSDGKSFYGDPALELIELTKSVDGLKTWLRNSRSEQISQAIRDRIADIEEGING